MNWYILLTYTDGTTEKMYCTTRDEARTRARFYRSQWIGESVTRIGKPLVSATVQKVA